jgi:hypothetical protein
MVASIFAPNTMPIWVDANWQGGGLGQVYRVIERFVLTGQPPSSLAEPRVGVVHHFD